uniref:Uncharacterized protein n=1 Tax=Timema poppense TaxID=170557 RepID=A0A7R9CY90_TIMPO|nr:unnamed protein product [Timema poppensis]
MCMKLKRASFIIIQIVCVTFLESVNALHVNEFCTSNQLEQLNLLVGKITDLNICRHGFGLKLLSSCSLMSEEEISKMSVNLLNCQSAIEGRQQFPCTDDMSLEECTHLMDPITRNTHALIKMRALSVCDSVKMEMTINKLITATRDQLAAMRSLIQEYHIDNKGTHKELLKDCDEIKNSLHTILKGISSHIKLFRAKDDILASRHEDIININRKLNTTIYFLQEALDKFNHNFNALIWITNYATADQIELACIILLHGIYLVMGMVIAKLMQASKLNKAFLFLTVVFSLVLTLKNGIQDIFTYSALIFSSFIEQLILSAIQAYIRHNSRVESTHSHSSTGGDTQIQTHTLRNSFKDQLTLHGRKLPCHYAVPTIVLDSAVYLMLSLALNFVSCTGAQLT